MKQTMPSTTKADTGGEFSERVKLCVQCVHCKPEHPHCDAEKPGDLAQSGECKYFTALKNPHESIWITTLMRWVK